MFKENKKAQVGTTMTLGLATLIIIFLIIAFVIISTFIAGGISRGIKTESITMSSKEEALTSLFAYLQTPVSISIDEKEQEIIIADLIRLATVNRSYEKVLQEKSKEILDPVYKGKYALHALPLEIVSVIGRPSFAYTLIPSKEPIQVIFGLIEK